MTVIPRYAGGPGRRLTIGSEAALVGLVALLSLCTARVAGAACSTAICVGTATACTISGANTVDDDCILDWSGKDVTLASGASLKTASDGQNFTVLTDDFDVIGTIQDRGAPTATPLGIASTGFFKIRSTGKIDVTNGGSVTVSAAGFVQLDGLVSADGGGALVDGGGIDITSTGSTLSASAVVHASGPAGGSGGSVSLTSSTGAATVSGALTANGGSGSTGGSVAVTSAGTMSISGAVNANGGTGNDGGEVDLTSGDDMAITAHVAASGNGSFAFGGTISIDSGGAFLTTKRLHAVGDSDGDGGTVEVTAVDGSEFDDTVRASGGSSGGTGGSIAIDAASVLIKSDWANNGSGSDGGTIDITAETGTFELQSTGSLTSAGSGSGSGGDITITAAGTITQNGPISSTGSGGGDGAGITIDGSADVNLAANIAATGSGTDSSGGTIDVTGGTNHTVTITKILDARSTSSAGFFDGDLSVEACNVTLSSPGVLKTRNTNVGSGRNFVTYRNSYTLGSSTSMLADDPAAVSCSPASSSGNFIYCRCPDTSPADGACDSSTCVTSPTLTGTVTPTALICPIPLPACG